jgi:hypothetical protein
MPREVQPSQSTRALDPLDVLVAELAEEARQAIRAATWTCSDGHEHPRPEDFTHNRLVREINNRNPGNSWSSAAISLAVYRLVELGELVRDPRLRLRVRS